MVVEDILHGYWNVTIEFHDRPKPELSLAKQYDIPLVLLTLGIIYIIETLSDIIQISYYKATHGKRVFKMAPFHHHLEMGGWTGKKWKEKELFWLYTCTSLVFAIISFIGIYTPLVG